MNSLANRVALVTGATGSMGVAIAQRLADEGAAVVGVGRTEDSGQRGMKQIVAGGGRACFVVADVGCEEQVRDAVAATIDAFGRLDIVVNAAAATELLRGASEQPVVDEPTEVFDRMMRVNLYGPFWTAKYAIPHMLRTGDGGAIVSVSSISSSRVDRAMPGYAASKAGLEGLTRQIAADYGDRGIRVNAIALGSIRSIETAHIHDDPINGPARRRNRMIPEPGTVEDVAELVAFLASPRSGFLTAAVVPLDGGALSAYPAPVIADAGRAQGETDD
jgi:NAD(P)-dependent dehydrogenase (short-subunit alcohol dehydrogenase family)